MTLSFGHIGVVLSEHIVGLHRFAILLVNKSILVSKRLNVFSELGYFLRFQFHQLCLGIELGH